MELPRIETEDLTNKGVVGLPRKPGYSYSEMQDKFDELVLDVVVPKFNDLSDMLVGTLEVNYVNVPTTAWTSNSHATYTKKAHIASTLYTADFEPVSVDLVPADNSAFFSSDEEDAMGLLNPNVEFDNTGVTFYATDTPSTILKFRIRGED